MKRIQTGGILLLLSFLFLVPLAFAGELTTTNAEPAANAEEQAVKTEEPAAQAEVLPAKSEESTVQTADQGDRRPLYTVGIGDVLVIRLREGVKLSEFDATVMSTGTVVISFIEVKAAGHTIPEIREEAQKELGKYIRDFSVDLIPKEWKEKKVIVLGEVEKPGVYNFSAGMTTVQAVALAGGFKNTAVLSDTRIVRGNLDHPELIQVDLHKTAKGKDTRDVLLAQNDVIFVPRSVIGDWNNFINLYLRPTLEVISLPISSASTAASFPSVAK